MNSKHSYARSRAISRTKEKSKSGRNDRGGGNPNPKILTLALGPPARVPTFAVDYPCISTEFDVAGRVWEGSGPKSKSESGVTTGGG